MSAEKILEAITVTAELTGTQLSEIAKAAMVEDLLPYPPEAVMKALMRCRRELTGRLTLAAVLERLNGEDGRPGPDEAWAMALAASDESETVVWTEETAEAAAVAMPILDAGDKVGARMAFKQAYERLLDEARQQARPAKWQISLGYDSARRTDAIQQGVEQGKLLPANVQHLLPAPSDAGPIAGLLVGKVDESVNTISRERLAELRRMIDGGKARRAQEKEREQREFEARKQAAIKAVEERLGMPLCDAPELTACANER